MWIQYTIYVSNISVQYVYCVYIYIGCISKLVIRR